VCHNTNVYTQLDVVHCINDSIIADPNAPHAILPTELLAPMGTRLTCKIPYRVDDLRAGFQRDAGNVLFSRSPNEEAVGHA
jgi:hypothetical protein